MSEAAAAAGFSRLLSDERLTRRAVGGDERAFAAIFQRYHQSLYRFCLTIVGNSEDAQEALQNTMMKVLRALPGEERTIDLKPWLYRIAHNESIDLLRRRRETRELDVEQIAPGYGLTEDVATRERLRQLIADLRELPERQREVLVMRELAGLDFEEIGAAMETSGAVVRQTLYEARQSLHQMEEGREMSCEAVTKALSDGDGRVIRRRDVRAHLRACADCSAFGDEIKTRQQDLAALSPLPAVAVAGMLQGLIGGSGAASGGGLAVALGGGAAKTISASAAAKGVATVAVAAAIGVTAADRTGVIHVGLPGGKDEKSSGAPPAPASGHAGSQSHPQSNGGAGQQAGNGANGSPGSPKGQGAGSNSKANRGANGKKKGHGHAAKGHPGVRGHGPQGSHPGRGQEKSSQGQEAAGANKPPAREPPAAAERGGQPAQPKVEKPAPNQPAKEPPAAAPPAAAPETKTQPESGPKAGGKTTGSTIAGDGQGGAKAPEKIR
ncbi:MAG TPA: RNA polymerase sigma factor [Solirubrobacterales bacterium]|nr:RNA polymerase sigma factor [Solirubrobacterales bacterium]